MLHASLKNGVTSLTQRAASGLSGVHGPTLGMQGASWQASRCRAVAFDQSQHGLSTSARWVTRAAAAGKHMRLSQRGCVLARCQTASGFFSLASCSQSAPRFASSAQAMAPCTWRRRGRSMRM